MLPSFLIFIHFFFFFGELSCEHIVIHSTLNSPAYVALNPSILTACVYQQIFPSYFRVMAKQTNDDSAFNNG